MSALRPALLFALGAVVAGCHGGNSSAPPTLKIQSRQPEQSSVVEVDTAVAVVFADALDPTSLGPDALSVRDGCGVLPGAVAYAAPTRTLTWTPSRELPRGAGITASLASTVRGSDGHVVPANQAWTFRVRPGTPAAPVVIRSGAVVTSALLVGVRPNGSALVVEGAESWEFGAGAVGPTELLPIGVTRALHIDGQGGIAIAGHFLGTSGLAGTAIVRRDRNGAWSSSMSVGGSAPNGVIDLRLFGNERGDLLLHGWHAVPPSSSVRHEVSWSSAATPNVLQPVVEQIQPGGTNLVAGLDGPGGVAVLRIDGDFVIGARYDLDGATQTTHTLAQQPFSRAVVLAADAGGRLRAVWRQPGGLTMQNFAGAGEYFGHASTASVFVPNDAHWEIAPSGALVGWSGTTAVRSAANSELWETATLASEPLAAAISPRGEAAFVYFQSPDQWLLVRWRAGEPIDPPLLLAAVPSPFAAARGAAVAVDDGGRVVAVFVAAVPADLIGVRVE